MNKLLAINKSNYTLTNEQKNDVIRKINANNIERMNIVLAIFIIAELLFITFNDIPFMMNPESNMVWNDSRFFIMHLLTLTTSIIGLVLIKIIYQYKVSKIEHRNNRLIIVLTILLLSFMAIINGLDQIIHENISSVFIANLIIFGSVIALSFPLNLAVYTIPFLIYLGGLAKFSHDTNFLISNTVNGVIFFVAVIIISTVFYNYHYDRVAKNIVLEETISKLNYLSNHDPLTGLMNRRYFGEQVAEKMKNITLNKQATLILMDIDNFKQINDTYGHPIGDIVLMEVSNILMEKIKTNNIATRWGGEEFLLFLFDTTMEEAYALAENIRLEIQDKIILADTFQIMITASFGISLYKNGCENSFDTAYKTADMALYQAKDQGRNKVVRFSPVI